MYSKLILLFIPFFNFHVHIFSFRFRGYIICTFLSYVILLFIHFFILFLWLPVAAGDHGWVAAQQLILSIYFWANQFQAQLFDQFQPLLFDQFQARLFDQFQAWLFNQFQAYFCYQFWFGAVNYMGCNRLQIRSHAPTFFPGIFSLFWWAQMLS